MSEPFPSLEDETTASPTNDASSTTTSPTPARHADAPSDASTTLSSRIRSASKRFNESSPPLGFMAATGEFASSIPSVNDIRGGSFNGDGWSGKGQIIEKERRKSLARTKSSQSVSTSPPSRRQSAVKLRGTGVRQDSAATETIDEHTEAIHRNTMDEENNVSADSKEKTGDSTENGTDATSSNAEHIPRTLMEPYPNGYEFPPKHNWKESTIIGLKASWKFVTTPVGFLITIYGLNIIGWGGMLFLLLCDASMCNPNCGDINSPRRIWIEIDSQILNALFCVTGFGLIPWRFRDFYHLLNYRINKTQEGLTRLAGIHRDWFRLSGSQELPVDIGSSNIEQKTADISLSSIPYPPKKIPDAPLTGVRAPATPLWKLDFVIWAFVANTALQAVLSGFMWGFNRYNRPSWSTGLFVALACIVAAAGGLMIFIEGKRVKSIEGVPVSDEDKERLRRDRELGITHYNNIKDAPPKEKKSKAKKESALKEEIGH